MTQNIRILLFFYGQEKRDGCFLIMEVVFMKMKNLYVYK